MVVKWVDSHMALAMKSRSNSLYTILPFDFTEPLVMGVLNTTPDSFSDGGKYTLVEAAVDHALRMVDQGADIIDVGGESTRPGAAQAVSAEEELDRVIPVVEGIRSRCQVFISLDTSTSKVMIEGQSAGANMINDVRALQRGDALEVAAGLDLPVCLMHMKGTPESMQNKPHYEDLLEEIGDFFKERIAACEEAGIGKNRLLIDPGFGFGKTVEHNMQLLSHLAVFKKFELPILLGISKKSTIGNITGRDLKDRLSGSIAGAVIAAMNGANIIRVHDVKETVDAMGVLNAVLMAGKEEIE